MATKYLSANKTAENSHIGKWPYNVLNKYASCMPMDCVPVDALLIPVAKSLL